MGYLFSVLLKTFKQVSLITNSYQGESNCNSNLM
jgi:hypothetical protein